MSLRRWIALAALASLPLLPAGGCSSAPASPPYDSAKAVETLTAALDAWKQQRVATLARRTPPLRFEDDDCRHGLRLIDYRLGDPPQAASEDVEVTLVLRDRRGNTVERVAVYQVSLEPHAAVLRND